GGRGKGTFKNGFKGGVHVRKTAGEVREVAAKMLGQILVTHQTGPAGRVVNKVLVAESAEIAREIYFAVLLDRATAAPLIVASTEGGVEIETVAATSPRKIVREKIDPLAGLQPFQTRKLAKQLGLESSQLKSASKLFEGLYRTFIAFYGGEPANFLDVGGGATEEQVTEAFKILISDNNVKAILVNIFGGIMKCDVIAQGIINAAKTVKLSVPLVVRLEGTNAEKGKQLLKESGLALITASDLADAAKKAVAAANSKLQPR